MNYKVKKTLGYPAWLLRKKIFTVWDSILFLNFVGWYYVVMQKAESDLSIVFMTAMVGMLLFIFSRRASSWWPKYNEEVFNILKRKREAKIQ